MNANQVLKFVDWLHHIKTSKPYRWIGVYTDMLNVFAKVQYELGEESPYVVVTLEKGQTLEKLQNDIIDYIKLHGLTVDYIDHKPASEILAR